MEINISKINFAGSGGGGICPPCPEYTSQEKSVEITENGLSTVSPDSGFDGLSEVSINVAVPIPQLQSKDYSIVTNGDTVISPDSGFGGISGGTINVNVPTPSPTLQEKSVSITQNGQSSVTADTGYDGLSKVDISVNVASSGGVDITLPYVNLTYYSGSTVPSEITGWNNLTDGSYKCMQSNLTSFSEDLEKLEIGGGADNEYSGMFYRCDELTNFNSELPNLTDGSYMFYNCRGLTTWNINLPNITNGEGMFASCSISTWNIELPKLTDGSYMFYSCPISTWNINLPNLTNGKSMFQYCSNIETFNSDLSSLTIGDNMFNNLFINLTTWNIELPKLTSSKGMFGSCMKLQTFSSNLSSLNDSINMFYGCSALENFTLTGTLNCNNFDLSDSTKLTVDSLVNVISVLVDLTGQSSKTLKLGSTNLEKLSEEQKAVATNKNWVLQ